MFQRIDRRGFGLAAIWLTAQLGLPTRWLHRLVYRGFGRRLRIGRGTYLLGRQVSVGRDVTIGKRCDIVAESITIEDGVTIGDGVTVRCKTLVLKRKSRVDSAVTIRGVSTPRSAFELGADGWIFSNCFLNPDDRIVIGDRTALGSHCLVFTHSSYLPVTHGYPVRIAPVTIGADVWLPWHVFVLPGVVIGDGATVGAFSMVAASVPANSLAVGVPARVVKDASSFRRRYDATGVRQLGSDMLRDALSRWEGSFRARDVFRSVKRRVQQIDDGHWQLVDRGRPAHVRFIDHSLGASLAGADSRTLLVTVGSLTTPAPGSVWVDLQTLQSDRLSSAGPEISSLVDVLSQFGLRFDWLPSDAVTQRLRIDPPVRDPSPTVRSIAESRASSDT